MAMGHKQPAPPPVESLPQGQGQPFYQHLEAFLTAHDFDGFVEDKCRKFYAKKRGRPSHPPGLYFRALLMGYFEGLGSERAIAWRIQDSMSLRAWLGFSPAQKVPVHSTLSHTRQRISLPAHRDVFRWVLARLGEEGLLCGRTLGIDASTIQANASLKTLVRREGGQNYQQFLDGLLQAAGVKHPTAEDRRRLDRTRKKKLSNKEWKSPHDPHARILKLKDGRTRLGYKDEQTVDLDTGAVVAVVTHLGDRGDPQSLKKTMEESDENLVSIRDGPAAQDRTSHIEEWVGDKGYHCNAVLVECERRKVRSYFSEPSRGRRTWHGQSAAKQAVYANRRRIRGPRGKRLLRKRGELLERPFRHRLDLGGLRRVFVRGLCNVQKRSHLCASAQNLGLLMRHRHGIGTPRCLQDRRAFWMAHPLRGEPQVPAPAPLLAQRTAPRQRAPTQLHLRFAA
jgi:transposase